MDLLAVITLLSLQALSLIVIGSPSAKLVLGHKRFVRCPDFSEVPDCEAT